MAIEMKSYTPALPMFVAIWVMIFFCTLHPVKVNAQGCIGVKSINSNTSVDGSTVLDKGDMELGIGFRYFKSFRHFTGDHEDVERVEQGTNVINHVYAWDLLYTYGINKQWNISADIPYTYNLRSQLSSNTDSTKVRTTTSSTGIGDIRLSVNRWMFDTYESTRGNLSLGIGLKFPTGKYNAMDTFKYKGPDHTDVYREVDQSIQLGDGGWGFDLESEGYANLFGNFYGYYTLFYLFNPMDTNDAQTYRSNPFEAYMSIPDQFLVRLGMTWAPQFAPGLAINLGGRWEGISTRDVLGKTDGFRRPGEIIDVEPGITYETGNNLFSFYVPVAVYRNRTRSVADSRYQAISPKDPPRHGDAAFADYLVYFNYTYRFNNKKTHHESMQGSDNNYINQ